ncbi:helix-turn-helix domain-containing protein [Streptomyces sp. M19]
MLKVHPQTVRYRLRQIEKLFGPGLRDPRIRFELEMALRGRRLAVRMDRARHHSRAGRRARGVTAAGLRPWGRPRGPGQRAVEARVNGLGRARALRLVRDPYRYAREACADRRAAHASRPRGVSGRCVRC